jgi:glycosyltransferase involved in cell wall biosynthesis
MKISIITVSYNSAATIVDTLKSIDRQSYRNFEHIIIDGASVDGTVDILTKFDNASRLIYSEVDKGIYDAMNKGLSLASGDIIGFLNSDDVFADDFVLEKIVSAFHDPSVQVCFGDLVYVSKDNTGLIRYWKSKPYIFGAFSQAWSPAHPTFYVKKSVINLVGFFDLSYPIAADFEFMLRCLHTFKLNSAYTPHILIRMRVGGLSNSNIKTIISQNKEICRALEQNNVQYNFFKFFSYKIVNRLWQRFRAALNIKSP